MYDLSNLNDFEFEQLCRDIMQVKLKKTLHCYPRGVDGGVDICDGKVNPRIVIQAKHYAKSTFSQLLRKLRIEVDKVKKINPGKYYVCTSMELTRENKLQIIALFRNYMKDEKNIIAKDEIDNFLSEAANKDIVDKHYKLWLCSTNVLGLLMNQNALIDTSELLDDIRSRIHIFVDTESYYEASDLLHDQSVLIITGAPGVGKSVISKMLVLKYVNEGYAIRYVTDNNIVELKRLVSLDKSKKEIVLLDDFLGQHYLKIRESQPNDLKALISIIESSKNKKIILNSRVTIMQEAKERSYVFRELMEKHELNKYVVNLDNMNLLDKAQILYNHLYFSGLSPDYFEKIKSEKNYLKIVRHKNYNPRIIEYITKPIYLRPVLPSVYVEFVFNSLDNPAGVWRDEYKNRIEHVDRILLNILYSLTDSTVDISILERAFFKRLLTIESINTSINQFQAVTARLADSLIKIILKNKDTMISVINPSVNDYLRSEIRENPVEQVKIIKSAMYVEQIVKVMMRDDAIDLIMDMLLDGSVLRLSTLKNTPDFYFVYFVLRFKVLNIKIRDYLIDAIKRMHKNLVNNDEYFSYIHELLNEPFFDYYGLEDTFHEVAVLKNIVDVLEYENFMTIVLNMIKLYGDDEQWMIDIKYIVVDKLHDLAEVNVAEHLSEIIGLCMKNAELEDIDNFHNEESDHFRHVICEAIDEHYVSFVAFAIGFLDDIPDLDIDDFIGANHNDFSIWDTFEEMYHTDDDYDEDAYRERMFDYRSEIDTIENMFER